MPSDTPKPKEDERLLVTPRVAADMLSLSPWSVGELCKSGVLASGLYGKTRRLVSVESIRAYAERLTSEASDDLESA